MKIGKYKISLINNGYLWLDGGAMFGIIPRPLWSRTTQPDEQNRVQLATNSMLLISDSKKILVDTGMGFGWDEKKKRIYNISVTENSLASEGLTNNDITDVILTHLHFDHTGGSVRLENDKIVPAFPNARYYVQEKHFNWALNPSDKDRGSFIEQYFMPLRSEGVLNFTKPNDIFDDNISFIEANGHTFAQQMVKVADGSDTVLFCGDLIPFASHVHLPYVMAYDIQPLVTIEEKRKILLMAEKENWKLIFEHDPAVQCGTVQFNGKEFKIKESINEF